MTEATNTKLMNLEPGGENTQYEGQQTFTKSHAKGEGQFGDSIPTEASQQAATEHTHRGEQTAENVRYGEAISEHGFGGETVGNDGIANTDSGFGEVENRSLEGEERGSRERQGYDVGSGVGA